MKMKITITADEAIEKGIWDRVCKMKGFSVWCVNEGRMNSDHELSFTQDEAISLGLIAGEDNEY